MIVENLLIIGFQIQKDAQVIYSEGMTGILGLRNTEGMTVIQKE
jgi:hypothetical protein